MFYKTLPITCCQLFTTHYILNYGYYFLAYIFHKLYEYILLHSHKDYYAYIRILKLLTHLASMCLSGGTMSKSKQKAD